MSCPTSMCNSDVGIENLGQVWLRLLNQLPEFCYLANLLEGKDLILLVSINAKPSGVIASVFESSETCERSTLAHGRGGVKEAWDQPLISVSRMYLRSFSTR